MVTYNCDGDKYECKDKISELSLKEFYDINMIYEDKSLEGYEKGLKVLELVGLPSHIVEKLPSKQTSKAIAALNFSEDLSKMKGKKSFTLDGYKYKLVDLEDLSTKQFKKVKDLFKKTDAIKLISAFSFYREDLSDTEHYDDAHIKHKAELFKDLNITYFIAPILLVQSQVAENIKILMPDFKTEEQ